MPTNQYHCDPNLPLKPPVCTYPSHASPRSRQCFFTFRSISSTVLTPIAETLAASLKRYLAARSVITGPLFPSPTNPSKHVSKDLATKWLLDAEDRAALEHLKQGCWHPFRRAWATSRKGLPLTDIAAAGGWRNIQTLARHYMMPDSDTLLRVVEGGAALREVQQR